MAKKMKSKTAAPETIEAEILRVTGASARENEQPETYHARLIKLCSELEDATWASLSEPAQDWVNEGSKCLNEKKPVPNFPDASSGGAETPTTKPPATGGESKPMKKSKTAAPAPEAQEKPAKNLKKVKTEKPTETEKPVKKVKTAKAEKPAKEPKPRGARGPRMDSPVSRLRVIIIENPNDNVDAIKERAAKEGFTLSGPTIQTIYSHTAATMKIARTLGVVK